MVAGEAGLPAGLPGRELYREKQRAPRGEDMKTRLHKRLALLAGLLILSSLVFATGILAATPTTSQDGWLTAANTAARDQGVAGAAATPTTSQDGWLTAANTAARNRGVGAAATPTTTQDSWVTSANTASDNQGVVLDAATPTLSQDGWLTAANTAVRQQGVAGAADAQASGAPPASSGTSFTTAWIAVGSVAAVLLVGFATWALMRRRQPGELPSAAYCAQHPEDPLCRAV